VSHPSQNPSGEQFTGYGYGGQPIDPRTGWPYPPPGAGRPSRKSPGLGIASLVLGLVALTVSWIPIVNYLSVILGLVGAVLGVVGIFKSHRLMSIIGTALSVTAIVVSFIAFASFANSVDQAVDDYNKAVAAPPTAYTPPPPSTQAPVTEWPKSTVPGAGEALDPCVGYGCSDEQDTEINRGEAEANADEDVSVSQSNATEKAESYLSWTHFSRSGLIDQLEFEGFTASEATTAVDSLGIDWNEQAAGSAESYMNTSSFSRSGLIDQLEFEGFTTAQAQYGADSVGL
jgi:hypothetical protein